MPAQSVEDLVGNANAVGAELTVAYSPQEQGLTGLGVAANSLLGASLGLCMTASVLASWLLPFAPASATTGVAGCGALALLGYAQSFYLTGQVSAKWMPQNYAQVADTFGWTVGEIRCVCAGAHGQAGGLSS